MSQAHKCFCLLLHKNLGSVRLQGLWWCGAELGLAKNITSNGAAGQPPFTPQLCACIANCSRARMPQCAKYPNGICSKVDQTEPRILFSACVSTHLCVSTLGETKASSSSHGGNFLQLAWFHASEVDRNFLLPAVEAGVKFGWAVFKNLFKHTLENCLENVD